MVQGKQFVLIVDESQNLSNAVLETVRLLSNFETAHSKLLQIVLAGQTELANKLKQPELSQLLQRITVMASLDAFSFEETAAYIRHRLKLAGHTGEDLFDPAALAAVYRRSKGIPRNINRICHAALSLAQAEQVHVVSSAIVEKSNRGLGPTVEELQKSRFAGQPHPVAPTGVQAPPPTALRASATGQTPREPVKPPAPPDPTPPAPASSVAAPPTIPDTEPASVPPAETLPPPLPDYVPPEPARRSHRWLAWTVAFAALPVLVALAAPSNVRQAFLQKIQPIVGSTVSRSESRPDPDTTRSTVPTPTAKRAPPASDSVSDPAKSDSSAKGLKIVIDPGHGGAESGTRGPNGLLEKSVCLEVALRLGQLIEDELPSAEVIYTRSEDQNLSAQRRAAVANESSADLFISIHADSLGEGQGPQVYYEDGKPTKKPVGPTNDRDTGRASLHLADDIQNAFGQQFALKGEMAPMRATAQPAFAVLDGIQVPAVVAEIPFSEKESPLLDPTQRQRVAEALYRGISSFVKNLPDRITH
jgi:N-acetylmuramoyl-L-alanine amidase